MITKNAPAQTEVPQTFLAGLTPAQFMRRHWQKKPLLIRQAFPQFQPLLTKAQLFDLAARDNVESRLVQQSARGWTMRHGPFTSLPSTKRDHWTLLVQGVDLHDDAVHALLRTFCFIPASRLDDVMISYATTGGGVGPHFDSYDVFLLQAYGRRRWRIARRYDPTLRTDVPLKILAQLQAEQDFVMEPGDMLYLPPGYAHEGVAQDECMTYSIGFRVPRQDELASEILLRLADDLGHSCAGRLYRDVAQAATSTPGHIPTALEHFAQHILAQALRQPHAVARALGEVLSEPKPLVSFETQRVPRRWQHVRLDRRTRMLYDERHIFVNGEAFRASGKDAQILRQLADTRTLDAKTLASLSTQAKAIICNWYAAGWLCTDKPPVT